MLQNPILSFVSQRALHNNIGRCSKWFWCKSGQGWVPTAQSIAQRFASQTKPRSMFYTLLHFVLQCVAKKGRVSERLCFQIDWYISEISSKIETKQNCAIQRRRFEGSSLSKESMWSTNEIMWRKRRYLDTSAIPSRKDDRGSKTEFWSMVEP